MKTLGVVLAGGKSSRMGCDKALLQIDGQTLLERATATLAPHCEQIVVSGRMAEGLLSIPDTRPGDGPMGGLATIAEALDVHFPQVETVLLAPCDMPFVPSEAYRILLDVLQGDPTLLVAVATNGAREFPLTAAYRREGLQRMAASYATGNHRVFRALQALPWQRVALAEAWLVNINTPEVYRKALASE